MRELGGDEAVERHLGQFDVLRRGDVVFEFRRVREPVAGQVLKAGGTDPVAALRDGLAGVAGRVREIADLGVGIGGRGVEPQQARRLRGQLGLDAAAAQGADVAELRDDRAIRQRHLCLSLEILEIGPEAGDVQLHPIIEKAALEADFIGVAGFRTDRVCRAGRGETGADVIALALIPRRIGAVEHDCVGQVLAERDLIRDLIVGRLPGALDQARRVVRRLRCTQRRVLEPGTDPLVVEPKPSVDMGCVGDVVGHLREGCERLGGGICDPARRGVRAAGVVAVGVAVGVEQREQIIETTAAARDQAEFLREVAGVEAGGRDRSVRHARAGRHRGIAERRGAELIEILDEVEAPVLIGGDRDQVRAAEVERRTPGEHGLLADVERLSIQADPIIGIAEIRPLRRCCNRRTEDVGARVERLERPDQPVGPGVGVARRQRDVEVAQRIEI